MKDLEDRMKAIGAPLVVTPFTEEIFKTISNIIGEQVSLEPEMARFLEDNFWDLCEVDDTNEGD